MQLAQSARPQIANPYDEVHLDLISKFGMPEDEFALRDSLRALHRAFPNPRQLAGLKILDIACGCIRGSAEADANRGTWAPWLCRAVDILGGHAVGLDIGRVSSLDTFEFHRCDLTHEDTLVQFEDSSFDGISCSNLFSSPHLVYRLQQSRDQRAAMAERIQNHVNRLLGFGGVLIEFDNRLDNH